MALTKIDCPECGAGLKSEDGFTVGESVDCPKCETSFTVRADSASAKAGKSDDARSYKSSPARYAVLGVLVAVMIVLGVMLIKKKQKDRETEDENAKLTQTGNEGATPFAPPPGFDPNGKAQPHVPPPLNAGPGMGGFPKKGNNPPMNLPKNPPPQNTGANPLGNLLGGGGPAKGSPEYDKAVTALYAKLVGSWEGTAPDGVVHKVAYQGNGEFTLDVGGKSSTGKWSAAGLAGGKVLKITRGTATLKVTFEGDELLHDTETPGVSVVMKKK